MFLVDIKEFAKMNAVYSRVFDGHRPARTTVEVSALPEPDLRVEIDAVALIEKEEDEGGRMKPSSFLHAAFQTDHRVRRNAV